ncbi:hypothetical protein FHG87_014414 [Trinorchestia longiramus]|nr:hypothetical protein FHG87_014414 [Trinorchestia longiramus]
MSNKNHYKPQQIATTRAAKQQHTTDCHNQSSQTATHNRLPQPEQPNSNTQQIATTRAAKQQHTTDSYNRTYQPVHSGTSRYTRQYQIPVPPVHPGTSRYNYLYRNFLIQQLAMSNTNSHPSDVVARPAGRFSLDSVESIVKIRLPRGSVSQSQGFSGDQETHLTNMIRDGTLCCPSLLQMITLHHLANLCCREFSALSSRLVTVVMVKRARFDEKATLPVLGFVPINKPILTASYEVAYLIAKQGKPLTIGETLVKPAVLKMVNIMLGEETEVKLSQIPLSNGTISDRIEDMSKDILAQVVADLISSLAKSSLQLDETTDVSNLSQLAILLRYVKDDVLNEDFLFCKPLTTTIKAAEVKNLVDNFFKDNSLSWDMVSAVCSDRVPVTLGRKSGFGAVVKADAPHIIVTHCILHRHALATKMLPPKLAEVLKIVDCVNYMQSSALRHRIFTGLCKEMGSEFEVLLYHSYIGYP